LTAQNGENDSLRAIYDLRRESRGKEPTRPPRPWLRRLTIIGIVVLVVGAVVGGIWIWWCVTHVTTVRATVCAAIVSLSSTVDALVVERYVDPGDRIKKGQPLVRLDDSQLSASLDAAKADVAIKESLLAQAKSEHELAAARVEAAVNLAEANLEIAKAAVAKAQAEMELQQARLGERVRQAKAEREEMRARLDRIKKGKRTEVIESARARLETAKRRTALYELEAQQTESLVKQNIVSPLDLEIKRTQLAVQRNETREAELELSLLISGATPLEIEQNERLLEARDAALRLAEADRGQVKRLEAELEVQRAQLREAEAQLRKAEATRLEVALAAGRVKAAAAELAKARASVAQRQAALKSMTIVSPADGLVIRTFDDVGEVCRKGVPIMLVADETEGYWIEAFVNEEDAVLVRPKQKAEVEVVVGSGDYIDAEVSEVGLSTASLDRISQSAVTGGATVNPRKMTEMVWVKLMPIKCNVPLLPGMSARAIIRVR